MNTLYERLMHDHRNLESVLQILEQEVGRYDQQSEDPEKGPRLSLIMEILDYVHYYPEYVHHPLEEAAMDALREQNKGSPENMDLIHNDHLQLEQESEAVREMVQTISVGSPVSLDQLHARLDAWIAHQRRHIRSEEDTLFRAIEQLDQPTCDHIMDQVEHRADPVFGQQTAAQFEGLTEELQNY